MTTPSSKVCTQCGIKKSLDDFAPEKRRKSGKSAWCRACTKAYHHAYYATNKERTAPMYAGHREAHREENRIYSEHYYWTNKDGKIAMHLAETREIRLAKRAVWRDENREDLRAYDNEHKAESKQRHARNYMAKKSIISAKNAAWRKANPAAVAVIAHRRRAHQANAPVNDLSAAQWQEVLEHFDFRCVYCPPRCQACKNKTHVLTQDHITPFDQQGSHTLWNVVPACREHNSEKHTGRPLNPVQPLLLTVAQPKKRRKKRV